MSEISKVIVFQLKNQQYGVDIQQIRSIEKLQNITEIPNTPDFIKGVINLRSEVIAIIDLRERLHINKTDITDHTRILIVSINEVQIGLIVDSATEVLDIDPTVIDPSPEIVGEIDVTFVKGVAKLEDRLLILLDLERVLSFKEIDEVKEAVAD